MTEVVKTLEAKYIFQGKEDPNVLKRFAQDVLGMSKEKAKFIKPGNVVYDVKTEEIGMPQKTVKFITVEWAK